MTTNNKLEILRATVETTMFLEKGYSKQSDGAPIFQKASAEDGMIEMFLS